MCIEIKNKEEHEKGRVSVRQTCVRVYEKILQKIIYRE